VDSVTPVKYYFPSNSNLELFRKNYTNLVNFMHIIRKNTKDMQNFLNINRLEKLLSNLNANSKALHLDLLVDELKKNRAKLSYCQKKRIHRKRNKTKQKSIYRALYIDLREQTYN
jgi:hypothetical protein